MERRGRAARGVATMLSSALCAGGLGWTVLVLGRGDPGGADTADVLSFWTGLVSAICGAWGLWAAVRGLQEKRTAEVIAGELAEKVVRAEGTQYRQLLGSGPSAPRERIDLRFAAGPAGAAGPASREEAEQQGELSDVTQFYRDLGAGRLLITGAPAPAETAAGAGRGRSDAGTGKTVLALALLLGLAQERNAGEPVPVRLAATSWPGGTMRQWLYAHLTSAYRLSPRDAALLVDAGLVLPVVDGLDEMDAGGAPGYTSRAAALLQAVDRFERGDTLCPVVLTCRLAQYQALVDADVQPRTVVHLALDRIDAARAHRHLARSVGATDVGRRRWRPVLAALEEAASEEHPRAHGTEASAALAAALDTPWRLTLAVTVFQERTPEGAYRRDPAGLLTLAGEGRLYDYLLDRYIGAAAAACPLREADPAGDGSDRAGRRPRLDARLARRRLTLLARYLDANAASRPPRSLAGRRLSSTDLVLHELWPLAGERRVRWVESALSVALILVFFAPLALIDAHYPVLALGLVPFAVLGVWDRTWPEPRRMNLRRLHAHAGLRVLAGAFGIVLVGGLGTGLGTGLGLVLVLGSLFTALLSEGATAPRAHEPVTDPRELLRGDLTARLVGGLGTGLVVGVGSGLLGGPEAGCVAGLMVVVVFWVLLGLTDGETHGDTGTGGHAALRYLAFLLCTRGRLPWRLGRFLDDCYRLGILRVAGTAWQFRHRELQDHLAAGRPEDSPGSSPAGGRADGPVGGPVGPQGR